MNDAPEIGAQVIPRPSAGEVRHRDRCFFLPFRRRLRRGLAAVALIVGLAWVFHAYLLRGLASLLVAEGSRAPATAVVVLDEGDRRFDVAAGLHRQGAKWILLYHPRADRLERMGIRMTADELARRELRKREVAQGDMQSLPEVPSGRSHLVAVLDEWLHKHPDDSVDLLCDRFTSRAWKLVIRRAADSGVRSRIQIVPLRKRGFDETNWWRSKQGMAGFVNGYLILGFYLFGETDEPEGRECTAHDFAAAFGEHE